MGSGSGGSAAVFRSRWLCRREVWNRNFRHRGFRTLEPISPGCIRIYVSHEPHMTRRFILSILGIGSINAGAIGTNVNSQYFCTVANSPSADTTSSRSYGTPGWIICDKLENISFPNQDVPSLERSKLRPGSLRRREMP